MRQKTRQALCYQGVLSHFKDQEIGVYFESSLFSVAVLLSVVRTGQWAVRVAGGSLGDMRDSTLENSTQLSWILGVVGIGE